MWMYQNGGGDVIQKKIVQRLQEREIDTVTGLDLRFAHIDKEAVVCKGANVNDLDLFFSYNAGEQTAAQLYLYEVLGNLMPMVNNFPSFSLTEDKLRTNMALLAAGVKTSDFFLCHRECPGLLREKFEEWKRVVFKPLNGWGGSGMVLIEDARVLEMLIPALHASSARARTRGVSSFRMRSRCENSKRGCNAESLIEMPGAENISRLLPTCLATASIAFA